MSSFFTIKFLVSIIRMATPIFFASVAAFTAASTGIGNIAIESIMTLSALFGVLGSYWTQNAVLGSLIGVMIGVLIGLIISFFSKKMGANPFLVGIALNTFADSLAVFFLYIATGEKGSSASLPTPVLGTLSIPVIKDIPVLGLILSGHAILTYACWLVIILLFILIYKTPLGMRMRACGLNPDAAKTAGINVDRLQVLSLVLSGLFAAMGGVYMSLNYLSLYSKSMIAGQGWMGIAANGLAAGNFGMLLLTAFIFSAFRAVSINFGTDANFPTDLVKGIPYFAVFVILIVFSVVQTYRIKMGNVKEE